MFFGVRVSKRSGMLSCPRLHAGFSGEAKMQQQDVDGQVLDESKLLHDGHETLIEGAPKTSLLRHPLESNPEANNYIGLRSKRQAKAATLKLQARSPFEYCPISPPFSLLT